MKQGCLFSQFVFSIVLEILGRVKDKKRQKDWKREVKLLFTDDRVVYIDNLTSKESTKN